MSDQDDLDLRTEEIDKLLNDIEALFPSLCAHGLHILSMDPAVFNQQADIINSRLPALQAADYNLGIKILSWFRNTYPKKEKGEEE